MTAIQLENPVTHDGVTYTELTLHRPNAGELATIERLLRDDALTADHQIAASIATVSVVAGVPIEVIRLLDFDDFNEVSEAAQSFLLSRKRSKAKQRS